VSVPAKPPSSRVIVVSMLVAAVLTALFATTYILSLGNPKPHDVPIAVVGPGAARVAAELERTGAFRTVVVPTAAAAREEIDARRVYAALFPVEQRLIVSQAAGYSAATFVSSALSAQAAARGGTLDVTMAHPLPPDDPRGLVLYFFVLAMVFGGYIGATVLSALAGTSPTTLRSGERRLIALALFSVVAGGLTTLVAGVALDHFAGHLLELTGLAILVVFAVAAAVAALQIAIGILGSLVAMIVFIWLGSQGSSGASAWELLPWFTRSIGPYLPAGAGVDAARSIVYFDGVRVWRDILVLLGYAAAGSLVVLLVGRRRGLSLPNEAELAPGTTAVGGV
jgi:hypothetical protein